MKRHLGPLLKLMLLLAFLSRLEFVFGQANYELTQKASATGTVGAAVQPKLSDNLKLSGDSGAGRAAKTFDTQHHFVSAEQDTWNWQPNNALNQSSSMSNSTGAERLQLKASPKVFSSKTDLSFMLKQNGKYKLEILNMQGTVVTVLAEGNGLAGEMQVYQFKKGKFAAGGYIARLITDNEITSTRFMLE
ncbi:hypothetical protein [Pontibacter sp. H249]|uniref:hypothetical protein n=1 Tax=Pontibacter sp. H249 TaxID=3133420 RepID=UPI0030BE6037